MLLRQVVLSVWWDGEDEPSVEVPLGDFFNNAFHRRPTASLVSGVVDGEYVSNWPMPFGRSARASLRNDSGSELRLDVRWRLDEQPEKPYQNYFHARWDQAVSRGYPYNLLRANGQGHYAGTFLTAIGMDGSWFIVEGDDFVKLNGETVPSIHGCGMEDSFNGAWYYFGLFDHPLTGLTEKAPVHLAQYRTHFLDAYRFDNGISVNWEFGHANKSKGYMSSVAFWYQPEPHPSGSVIPDASRRFPPRDPVAPAGLMSGLFELERRCCTEVF